MSAAPTSANVCRTSENAAVAEALNHLGFSCEEMRREVKEARIYSPRGWSNHTKPKPSENLGGLPTGCQAPVSVIKRVIVWLPL